MAKKNVELFEESSQGSVSAVTTIFFILSVILAFGGLVVAGYAFGDGVPAVELFCGGMAACFLGFGIGFNILPMMGK